MDVEETGPRSFERFCCSYKLFQDIGQLMNLTAIATATAPCFHDLNITQNEQINIVLDLLYFKKPAYNHSQCVVDPCSTPTTPSHIAYMCLWLLLLIVVVSSNFTVMMAIQRISYLRENAGNFFIASLAASDLLIGLFVLPVRLKVDSNNLNFCSEDLCRFYMTADTTLFSVSITNILLVSFDRYMALTFPYKYKNWMTSYRCKLLIQVVWGYGITWGVLGNINWKDPRQPSMHIRLDQCLIDNPPYIMAVYVFVFYIPAVIMAILYLRILSIARKHAKAISSAAHCIPRSRNEENNNGIQSNMTSFSLQPSFSTSIRASFSASFSSFCNNSLGGESRSQSIDENADICRSSKAEKSIKALKLIRYRQMTLRAARTVAIVYGLFFVCWFPVSVLSLLLQTCRECYEGPKLKWMYHVFVEVLPVFNSMMNSFVYAITSKHYRRAYRELLSHLRLFAKTHFSRDEYSGNSSCATSTTK